MSNMLKATVTGIILIFVAIMFIVGITPTFETNISSANITNPLTSTLVDMSEWVIPVLAIVGVILGGLAIFQARRNRG